MTFGVGDKVRHPATKTSGVVTERIYIEQGHQIEPPLNGSEGVYEERVDLRVQYLDDNGQQAEVLMHEADAEAA